jgi:hypothetical protein
MSDDEDENKGKQDNPDSDSESNVEFVDNNLSSSRNPQSLIAPEVSARTPTGTTTGSTAGPTKKYTAASPTIIRVGSKVYIVDNPRGKDKGDTLLEYYSENEFEKDLCKGTTNCSKIKELFKKYFHNMRQKKYKNKFEIINASKEDQEILNKAISSFIEYLEKLKIRYVKNILPKTILHALLKIKIKENTEENIIENTESISVNKTELENILLLMAWYISSSHDNPNSIRDTFTKIKETGQEMFELFNEISQLTDDTQLNETKTKQYTASIIKLLKAYKNIRMEQEQQQKQNTAAAAVAVTAITGGGGMSGSIPSQLLKSAINLIISYFKETNPAFSFVEQSIVPMYDVWGLNKLLHICNALSNYDKYGIYRISNVPDELFSYIQHSIKHSLKNSSSIDKTHLIKKNKFYQYLMCLEGNLSFVNKEYTKKQKKERKAVRTFFQKGDLYLLHTDLPDLTFENYMDDPYYAYEIDYDSIDEENMIIPINTASGRINEVAITLTDYITVNPTGILTDTQLAMSLFFQLKHLILEQE